RGSALVPARAAAWNQNDALPARGGWTRAPPGRRRQAYRRRTFRGGRRRGEVPARVAATRLVAWNRYAWGRVRSGAQCRRHARRPRPCVADHGGVAVLAILGN